MNTNQIDRVLRKNCSIYRGVFAADELPEITFDSRPIVIVANTDPKHMPGTHWVCIYFDASNNGEYFDSFGLRPSRNFESYINCYCSSWWYNERQLQSVISKYCGAYCVWFCIMKSRGFAMSALTYRLTNDTTLNDHLVHKFACKMV